MRPFTNGYATMFYNTLVTNTSIVIRSLFLVMDGLHACCVKFVDYIINNS